MLQRLADRMRRTDDGITRGIGPIAETLADGIGPAANMALAEIAPGGVEVRLRPVSVWITGGQGEQGGKRQKGHNTNHASIMPRWR